MASKEVLKEAIRAFNGTAIIVSHDREFLDGLVSKVYEFGGGKVREHLGGIYDFLSRFEATARNQETSRYEIRGARYENTSNLIVTADNSRTSNLEPRTSNKQSYAKQKEQRKQLNRAEKAVKDSERKIEQMEQRMKELDTLLCDPANASDMTLVTEYTDIKRQLDAEVERWEELSEKLEQLQNT
jgi:ATP-binding cassette subfamily F protein 3